jgi:hypothetical protein
MDHATRLIKTRTASYGFPSQAWVRKFSLEVNL